MSDELKIGDIVKISHLWGSMNCSDPYSIEHIILFFTGEESITPSLSVPYKYKSSFNHTADYEPRQVPLSLVTKCY